MHSTSQESGRREDRAKMPEYNNIFLEGHKLRDPAISLFRRWVR